MNSRTNPFFELYVGERLSGDDYVTIFSPYLVEYVSTALFSPGNVIVTGVQGSGKSMLLSLFKPEMRIAYTQARKHFPVPEDKSKFIGAGINLAHSGSLNFGLRPIDVDGAGTPDEILPIYFGDFLNYWIVADLIRSVRLLNSNDACREQLSIKIDESTERLLVKIIASDENFFGLFSDCKTLEQISSTINSRISTYKEYLNYNTDFMPQKIKETKTEVGAPISALANALWASGTIPRDVNIFVHIDQYEELADFDGQAGKLYRSVVNKALKRRDPSVSYRIGSRGHGWDAGLGIYRTGAKLEQERDYKLIALDTWLRRREEGPWIFPGFAADVFEKRLSYAHLPLPSANSLIKDPLLRRVFGETPSAEEKARRYAGSSPEQVVKVDYPGWPQAWKTFLWELAHRDPLSAKLGEAWALQKGKGDIVNSASLSEPYPWNHRKYWRKERVDQALMQIAGRRQQRLIWSGEDDIVELSGGNILVFLSICQHIWDAWLQSEKTASYDSLPQIRDYVQGVGIYSASSHWLSKILQETGRSGDRHRFIKVVGAALQEELSTDKAQSYPGHNGFSISDESLDRDTEVRDLLFELSDYGNLFEMPHTTKEKDKKSRRKWYLNPILTPQFKIPYRRGKEPLYADNNDIRHLMYKAGLITSPPQTESVRRKRTRSAKAQATLFDLFGGEHS